MFVGITNNARNYPWGSHTAIAELLGTEPTGEPEAELWLGAHPGSPARILDPASVSGAATLADWIAADPQSTGTSAQDGEEPRLPFLMKVLAAASPLSLQAHPTPEQARAGFKAENESGVPLDAPFRNYKDAHAKPELMLALSDTFEALCGFRPVEATRTSLEVLLSADANLVGGVLAEVSHPELALAEGSPIAALHARLDSDAELPATFEWLISRGEGVDQLVERVVAASAAVMAAGDAAPEFATVVSLAEQYPGDPGIVISLLINRVSLKRGEVLYLPAGNIHAYLEGLGIEVMAASDNVLRGGLTPKHVDVAELLRVLDFSPLPVPYLPATALAEGVVEFRPDVSDFVLVHAEGDVAGLNYPLGGPAIALCLSGSFQIDGAAASTTIGRGEAVYVTPSEGSLVLSGSGELVLATTGV
ncbi:mannose-6-phosphate isomerase type 1 [Glaciihabitans tibetensis]|uniref:mannose-6-phosphate isomerase n=1 Tax=Glaciihabitans tibetensis TaxID=1266600 RepID=A0A2T0VFC9_9MICO|nr:mannose-6-phosphate isomerase, class I [Glaciihabitans tibetensis]PRY68918.1 mannose-6-phosphate isomerase type 1 [Glaciihabitans tibetensis]